MKYHKLILSSILFFAAAICFAQSQLASEQQVGGDSIRSLSEQMDELKDGVYRWPSDLEKLKKSFTSTLLSGKAFDLAKLEVLALGLAPGKSVTFNGDSEHVLFVKSGSLTIAMRDSSWSVGKGSVIVILPGEKAVIKNDSRDIAGIP